MLPRAFAKGELVFSGVCFAARDFSFKALLLVIFRRFFRSGYIPPSAAFETKKRVFRSISATFTRFLLFFRHILSCCSTYPRPEYNLAGQGTILHRGIVSKRVAVLLCLRTKQASKGSKRERKNAYVATPRS